MDGKKDPCTRKWKAYFYDQPSAVFSLDTTHYAVLAFYQLCDCLMYVIVEQ